ARGPDQPRRFPNFGALWRFFLGSPRRVGREPGFGLRAAIFDDEIPFPDEDLDLRRGIVIHSHFLVGNDPFGPSLDGDLSLSDEDFAHFRSPSVRWFGYRART